MEKIAETGGAFITRGVSVDNLDRTKKWSAHLTVSVGDYLHGGDIIAEVPETRAIVHKCMVPPDLEGTVLSVVPDGEYTIDEVLVVIETSEGVKKELTMTQRWPIRVARPTHHRFPASIPLVTGQRIIDTMFPIAKGGTAAIPGGFGTGKTMTQPVSYTHLERPLIYKSVLGECDGQKYSFEYPLPAYGVAVFEY